MKHAVRLALSLTLALLGMATLTAEANAASFTYLTDARCSMDGGRDYNVTVTWTQRDSDHRIAPHHLSYRHVRGDDSPSLAVDSLAAVVSWGGVDKETWTADYPVDAPVLSGLTYMDSPDGVFRYLSPTYHMLVSLRSGDTVCTADVPIREAHAM